MISTGLNINFNDAYNFEYGPGVFGPNPELRSLDSIRKSLLDPDSLGPEIVYSIAMDVGKTEHKALLNKTMLLFGVVSYAAGQIGREPVRSQGHIHKISSHSGWSPPEVYEIWQGSAIIYMQEFAEDKPGKCYAVLAEKGDVVMVPPGWAHATISADVSTSLIFGAWCDREYGFLYDKVRAHKGLAWYALVNEKKEICWEANSHYAKSKLIVKKPGNYLNDFGIEKAVPIYKQFENDPGRFQFVSKPILRAAAWENFVP